ncbi:hypothetical protein T01_2698 [Trichinella spiralis]|uniref:Uncharacterized protein n=1 Tax=Trichinella spiralis TaxID=6334 RepID=A0A0V1BR98_TRISP|nr:hypothetical protein T01_2698 [Trichinella spiralis]
MLYILANINEMKKNIYTKYKRKFVIHSYERCLKCTKVAVYIYIKQKKKVLLTMFYAQSAIPEKNRQHLRGYLFGKFRKCLMQRTQTLLENNKRLNSKESVTEALSYGKICVSVDTLKLRMLSDADTSFLPSWLKMLQ